VPRAALLALLLSLGGVATASAQLLVQMAVAYHSQIPVGDPNLPPNWPFGEPGNPAMPNGYCTVACIDMLFNYWNDPAGHVAPPGSPQPQLEIAAAANTNDPRGGGGWVGTTASDARRAVHFSSTSAQWPNAPPLYVGQNVFAPRGYSWRVPGSLRAKYGWVAIDGDWGANHWTLAQLKQLLQLHVPLVVHLDPDSVLAYAQVDTTSSDRDYDLPERSCQRTAVGHSVVLTGYDDGPRNLIFFADPTRGPAWMMNQQQFWNAAWGGKLFLYIVPWSTSMVVPVLGSWVPNGFAISGTASYVDLLPGAGTGLHVQAAGHLQFLGANPVAKLAVGQQAQIAFNQVVTSGQLQQNSWNCATQGWNSSTAEVETWGAVQNAVCTSFPGGYNDDIGAIASAPVTVPPPQVAYDGSICDIPRDWGWWRGSHLAPMPPWSFMPGTPIQLTAQVANHGTLPATGLVLRWFWGDPALAQFYPDTNLHTISSTTLPPILPGGEVTSSPVTWVAPTANSLGQSYFGFFAVLEGGGDPMHDLWIETDNNLACRSYNRTQIAPGSQATLRYWAGNPEASSAWVVTKLATDKPPQWAARLEPAGADSVLLGPRARVARSLVVDANTPWQSTFDVYEYVYDTGGRFLRCTGGATFFVSSAPVDVGPVAGPPVVALAVPVTAGGDRVELSFSLPEPRPVTVSVFDVRGARLATLFRGPAPAGTTPVVWMLGTGQGRTASGIYIVRLAAGREAVARKLMVLR
jgi:hypothetical protein